MNDRPECTSSLISAALGPPGHMLHPSSKSAFRRLLPDHVALFNANLCLSPDGLKVWWGDICLTCSEPVLIQLATRLNETLHVLPELAARFENERQVMLSAALYSVTPSGHYKFQHESIERARDGSLRLRRPTRAERRRLVLTVGWPRLWRFWQVRSFRSSLPSGCESRATFLYIGGGSRPQLEKLRSPLLVVSVLRRGAGGAPWIGFEVVWYPTSKRHAPRALIHGQLARRTGWFRPYVGLHLHPGYLYELRLGLHFGRTTDMPAGG